MTNQPDYPGLVDLLLTTRSLVDAGGTVTLEPQEAEKIRKFGFDAQAGPWSVPSLPAHLVAGNPLLEALGDDTDPFWRPQQLRSEPGDQATGVVEGAAELVGQVDNAEVQRRPLEVSLPEASETECAEILAAVDRVGGAIERRRLQKKLWRTKAAQFNQAIQSLVERGLIHIEGNILVALHDRGLQSPRLPVFHGVPLTNDAVPPGDPALGLPGAADGVNGFRGGTLTHNTAEEGN